MFTPVLPQDSEAATATIRRIVRDEAGRDGYAVATQVELGEVGSERQMDPIEVKKLKVVLENAIRRAEGDSALSAALKREYEDAHAVAEKMVDANSDKGSVTKSFVIAGCLFLFSLLILPLRCGGTFT